ncbi:MAG: restriction endonuclease, partial [bacterium]
MTKTARNYQKTFDDLEKVASKFWPSELSEIEAKLSIIPLLLK